MFDNEKLKSVYEEQLLELPAINQEALKSFDWEKKLFEIGHKYGLHIDQTEDFWTETMLVLVGLEPATTYRDKLMTELAIAPADAEKITIDINTSIFGPIHDFIVRGGPIIEPVKQMTVPEDTAQKINNEGVRIIPEHDAQEQTAPTSFASMIKTGVVVPLPDDEKTEQNEVLIESELQNSLESVLGTEKTDSTTSPESASESESGEAIVSLEKLLGEGEQSIPPSTSPKNETFTITTSPLSITEPLQNKTNQEIGEPDKKLTALEKLQKMLAEEKTNEVIITTQEKTDHSLTKSGNA